MQILIMVVVVLLLIAIGPALLIWSLNTLFPVLAIPYTLQTLVAAMLLGVLVSPTVKIKK